MGRVTERSERERERQVPENPEELTTIFIWRLWAVFLFSSESSAFSLYVQKEKKTHGQTGDKNDRHFFCFGGLPICSTDLSSKKPSCSNGYRCKVIDARRNVLFILLFLFRASI